MNYVIRLLGNETMNGNIARGVWHDNVFCAWLFISEGVWPPDGTVFFYFAKYSEFSLLQSSV